MTDSGFFRAAIHPNPMTTRARIATFLYHDVSDSPSESGFQRRSALPYKQTRDVFSSHLDRIANSGFTPKLISDVDFQQPGKHVVLTFDDGGKGALHAAEELNRRGWKGHFFLTTSMIGSTTFLDAAATRYLHSCGHVIGSHSHTHPNIFKALSFERMIWEWRISCDLLSDLLGVPCITGSVPGGDVSGRVFESAHAAGMQFLFTSNPVLIPKREGSCWVLGRVCPKAGTPLIDVQRFAEFRGWTKELVRHRLKNSVKTAIFSLYRIYVRHAVE